MAIVSIPIFDPDSYRSCGELIRLQREARGLSLGDLGRRAGLTKACVWEIERNGRPNPTIGTLAKLAQALDVRIVDIIDERWLLAEHHVPEWRLKEWKREP